MVTLQRRRLVSWSVLAVAGVVALSSSAFAAPSASPKGGAAPASLPALSGPALAIDTLASDDAWAVGTHPDPADPDENNGLAVHWDGLTWTEFATPSLQPFTGGLVAIS